MTDRYRHQLPPFTAAEKTRALVGGVVGSAFLFALLVLWLLPEVPA